jgi:hypothetical protein
MDRCHGGSVTENCGQIQENGIQLRPIAFVLLGELHSKQVPECHKNLEICNNRRYGRCRGMRISAKIKNIGSGYLEVDVFIGRWVLDFCE